MAQQVKESTGNAGDAEDPGSIPGSRRSLRGGHSNPLQYSCLENPTDRGAWLATVCRVTKESDKAERMSRTRRELDTSFSPNNSWTNNNKHCYVITSMNFPKWEVVGFLTVEDKPGSWPNQAPIGEGVRVSDFHRGPHGPAEALCWAISALWKSAFSLTKSGYWAKRWLSFPDLRISEGRVTLCGIWT